MQLLSVLAEVVDHQWLPGSDGGDSSVFGLTSTGGGGGGAAPNGLHPVDLVVLVVVAQEVVRGFR